MLKKITILATIIMLAIGATTPATADEGTAELEMFIESHVVEDPEREAILEDVADYLYVGLQQELRDDLYNVGMEINPETGEMTIDAERFLDDVAGGRWDGFGT